MGVDPETGEMDIEVMEGRPAKSERDKLQRVTEEIAILEEEFAGNAL